MMRINILSDLHLEFGRFITATTPADVIVLAGDIHCGVKGIHWIREHFPSTPVLYVLGNHEYYRKAIGTLPRKLKDAAGGSNVHVLDNDSFTIGGVRFLGATLWSDFRIMGTSPAFAGAASQEIMNDFRLIRVAPSYRKFRSKDAFILHHKTMQWLRKELMRSMQKTVVVTHHAPSPQSLSPDFRTDLSNAAFASDLEDFIKEFRIDLWVHGHVHSSQDYGIHGTRVICNPRGYPDGPNPRFNAGLIVDL